MKKLFLFILVVFLLSSCSITPGLFTTSYPYNTFQPLSVYNPYSYDQFLYRRSFYNSYPYFNNRIYYQSTTTVTPSPRPFRRVGPRGRMGR